MKIIFTISFLTSLLVAQNPKVYSALGNVLYDNSVNIEKLKNINGYSQYSEKIDTYLKDVRKVKEYGFDVENEKNGADKKIYLDKLRELSKTNDFFERTLKNDFKTSIEDDNSSLFLQIIDNKMLDSQKYKSYILGYYFNHRHEINATVTIRTILNEDKNREKQVLRKESTKQRQEEKIQRIRDNDKLKQESIKKALEEEVEKNKQEIKKEQMDKLAK